MTLESVSNTALLPPQTHIPSQSAASQESTSFGDHPLYSDPHPSTQHSNSTNGTSRRSLESSKSDNDQELHDDTVVAETERRNSGNNKHSKHSSEMHSEDGVLVSPPTAIALGDQIQPDVPTHTDALQGSDHTGDWDPLRRAEDPKEQHRVHDETLVVEEGDVVDSNGRLIFPDHDTNPSLVGSRRASNLRLNISPPSPQPWDVVQPPTGNNDKTNYSPVASQKFHTMQSATHTRPLIPKSSYYFGPPPSDSAYGTPPVGQIGIHHPREIFRVERDYTGGEVIQFAPIYPLELEGRITPTQFLESINAINEVLISAHSLRHAFLDNMLAVFTLQLSRLFLTTHYEKEMQRLKYLIDDLNAELYNPVGLNIVWPRDVAFLFLEIEYY